MTAKHTPGPWHVYEDFDIYARDDLHIATLLDLEGHTPTSEQGKADARLIAAAPDLLAALKAMVGRWEPDTIGLDRVMWDDACDAIAKAES